MALAWTAGTSCSGGTGFVKFKGPITANELADRLLEHEILVFPPSIFDCDESLSQYFRIGFSRNTMPAALKAFQRFIDKQSFIDEQLNRSEQA